MISRLQKKCFIGATGLHGFLLLAAVVGPGFFTKPQAPSTPMIEVVTLTATDAINPNPGTHGSSQPAPSAPKPPEVQQQQPQPEPPPPLVRQVEPVQPREVEPPTENRRSPEPEDAPPAKPKKPAIRISTTVVKLKPQRNQPNKTSDTSDAQAKANAKAAADRARAFATASERIGSGLSRSTEIKFDGPPGDGGAGLANYGQIVRRRYTDAWVVPSDLTDDEATVKVSVTIARDGRVISSQIVDSTGSRLAANSIQKTLDRVTSIGVPFPDGAKESQRTFTMTFNLKAKQSFG